MSIFVIYIWNIMIVVYEICAMLRGLIVQLSSGNSRALRDIMDVYQKRLYKYALQYVKNEFVAEEIVEDVFVALWNKHTELKDVEDISGFLLVITRNLCLNYLRKEHLEMIDLASLTEEQIYQRANLYVLEDETLCSLVSKDYEEKLNNVLNKLPEKTRQIFLLSRRDGLKNKEIAEKMQLLEKSIEYHITKALLEIRKAIFE